MSKQKTLSRRHFLKGAAYTSALSMGGLSSLAFAQSKKNGIQSRNFTDGDVI